MVPFTCLTQDTVSGTQSGAESLMLGERLLSQSLGQMPPALCFQPALGWLSERQSLCPLSPCNSQNQTTTPKICKRCFRWAPSPLILPMSLLGGELLVPGLEAGGGYVENRNAPWDPQSMDQGVTT